MKAKNLNKTMPDSIHFFQRWLPLSLRAVLSTSSQKKVFFYCLPMKRVYKTFFKNSIVVLQFSIIALPQAKNVFFWRDHTCGERLKVQISQILSSAHCNNIAHEILSYYKLKDLFSWFTDKIWKLLFYITNLNEKIVQMQALIGLIKHISA